MKTQELTDEKTESVKPESNHKFLFNEKEIESAEAVKLISEFYGEDKAADVVEGLTSIPPRYSGAVHHKGRVTVKFLSLLAFVLLFCFTNKANAGLVSSNLYTLAAVNGTNQGVPVILGQAYVAPLTFFFQNTGLSTTNSFYANVKIGLSSDTNTFAIVGVYVPSSTNAQREAYTLTNQSFTIYGMVQMCTTNSQTVGADVVKNN